MKVLESNVQMRASHELQLTRSTEISHESNFRQVFSGVASSQGESAAAARERIATLLRNLVDAIMAAVNGKKCPENLAADCGVLPSDDQPAKGNEVSFQWRSRMVEQVCESETTTVCANGQVKTADGRSIDFSMVTEMARQFKSEQVYAESGSIVLRDPLILSFDGKAAELSERRIDFDLDADGCLEQIPGLGQGCGFLVFDRNGNGKADNGSELFGVASGNGFTDLAALDGDRNGWIDEADPVFKDLAIWSGEGYASLADRGIGALYTAAVDAPFSLKTASNELLGQIRAAGLYLTEAGEVGRMQQVDLVTSALPADKQPAKGEQLAS
jgi:hypothetical protein